LNLNTISSRYELAAAAIHSAGRRVTIEGIDEWLRAHDGRGCSPREASVIARRYWEQATPAMDGAFHAMAAELAKLEPWMRPLVMARLRKHQGATR
jgi:hypothetical protein